MNRTFSSVMVTAERWVGVALVLIGLALLIRALRVGL